MRRIFFSATILLLLAFIANPAFAKQGIINLEDPSPTPVPTAQPTPAPTQAPTPGSSPTPAPTANPTSQPSPTPAPTSAPTPAPTAAPTPNPVSASSNDTTPPSNPQQGGQDSSAQVPTPAQQIAPVYYVQTKPTPKPQVPVLAPAPQESSPDEPIVSVVKRVLPIASPSLSLFLHTNSQNYYASESLSLKATRQLLLTSLLFFLLGTALVRPNPLRAIAFRSSYFEGLQFLAPW